MFQDNTVINEYNLKKISLADKIFEHPHQAFKSIHITGTNGKGSVAKMVFSILQKAGKKVGCFTSPHLNDIRERIETDAGQISKKDFVYYLNKILRSGVSLSYFETLVMIAFLYFKDKKCEYAVIEVGMGGSVDATNIIRPIMSCITSIGVDHEKYLWSTAKEIAIHKAGIIKPGVPVVINKKNPIIEKTAKEKKAPIIFAKKKPTNLLWAHQEENAGLAYSICKKLWISENKITQGLKNVQHPGRLQYITKNLLIDGAHNIDGLHILKTYLTSIRKKYKKIIYCFGLKEGKDPRELIVPIFGKDKEYIIVKEKSIMLEDVASLAKKMIGEKYILQTPTQIKKLAKQNPSTLYVVFGSLYMIGAFI